MELPKRTYWDREFFTIRNCLFIVAIFKHADISIYVNTIFTLTKEKNTVRKYVTFHNILYYSPLWYLLHNESFTL